MIEDDFYRSTSQFRYWSFTKESLAAIRQNTNQLASDRVKAAFRRAQSGQNENGAAVAGSENETEDGVETHVDVNTLTVEEELKIVEWGCSKIVDMGEAFSPRIPSSVVATAIQYLRRFYLTNSPMTYHPKQIMMCALYLATKSDHWHISLHRFVAELPKVSEDDIKAPEFLLLQGLRFTLDVQHPMRGLTGGHAEMVALANEGQLGSISRDKAAKRIGVAADQAKKILSSAAQMTDAYFLFTPSQVWLGSLMLADEDLARIYLDTKFKRLGEAGQSIKDRILVTVSACRDLLGAYRSPEDDSSQRKEMKRIGKKLGVCQNPEKTDLITMLRAKAAEKREGADGSDADKALKKRKLEREKLERDGDVFGPNLRNIGEARQ